MRRKRTWIAILLSVLLVLPLLQGCRQKTPEEWLAEAQANVEIARSNLSSADTLCHFAEGRYNIGTITGFINIFLIDHAVVMLNQVSALEQHIHFT